MGINEAGDFDDVLNRSIAGLRGGRVGGWKALDGQGAVLTATFGVFGNRDGIVDKNVGVGVEGAFGVVDCDPIGDFGVFGDGGEVGGVFFAGDTIRGNGNFETKRVGVAGVGDVKFAREGFSWVEVGALGGGGNNKTSFLGV